MLSAKRLRFAWTHCSCATSSQSSAFVGSSANASCYGSTIGSAVLVTYGTASSCLSFRYSCLSWMSFSNSLSAFTRA